MDALEHPWGIEVTQPGVAIPRHPRHPDTCSGGTRECGEGLGMGARLGQGSRHGTKHGTRGRAGAPPLDGWMSSSMPRPGSTSCSSSVALMPQRWAQAHLLRRRGHLALKATSFHLKAASIRRPQQAAAPPELPAAVPAGTHHHPSLLRTRLASQESAGTARCKAQSFYSQSKQALSPRQPVSCQAPGGVAGESGPLCSGLVGITSWRWDRAAGCPGTLRSGARQGSGSGTGCPGR